MPQRRFVARVPRSPSLRSPVRSACLKVFNRSEGRTSLRSSQPRRRRDRALAQQRQIATAKRFALKRRFSNVPCNAPEKISCYTCSVNSGRKIFILVGHSNLAGFTGELAGSYESAALAAGHAGKRLNVGELKFDPVLHKGYSEI